MTIEEFLRDYNARLDYGNKWLVEDNGNWVVWYHRYGARVNKCLYNSDNLERALEILAQD